MVDLLNRNQHGQAEESNRGPRERVTIEPMRRADVPDVMALERRCYTLPWSASAYNTEIGNANARYLIAKREGRARSLDTAVCG